MKVELQKKPDQVWSTLYHRFCETYGNVQTKKTMVPSILTRVCYMLFETVVTNTVYYGAAFILYATGIWVPTLTGIALLFGLGNAFDCIVSLAAYRYLLRRTT